MEAVDWEELKFLLDSAGVPVDKAMGLGEEIPDDDDDEGNDEYIAKPNLFQVIVGLTRFAQPYTGERGSGEVLFSPNKHLQSFLSSHTFHGMNVFSHSLYL